MSQIAQLFHLLGFTTNKQIQFLGFLIDPQNLMIQLTQEKTDLPISTCRTIKRRGSLSVRELARLIGRMTVTTPEVFQVPLRYWNLQRLKNTDSAQVSILRSIGQLHPTAVKLVDNINATPEQEEYFTSGTRFDDGVRCLPTGVGCSVQRCSHRRTVVSHGEIISHQLP